MTKEEIEVLIERLDYAISSQGETLDRLKSARREVELQRGMLRAARSALFAKLEKDG